MIFMPLSQFVAIRLIRKVHSVVLRAVALLASKELSWAIDIATGSGKAVQIAPPTSIKFSLSKTLNFDEAANT